MVTRGRCPTDLTYKQWNLIKDLVPAIKPGGRPEPHSRREIVDAIVSLTRTGCLRRMLPKDMPPWQTVDMYFAICRDDVTVAKIHDALREEVWGPLSPAPGRASRRTRSRHRRLPGPAWRRHGRG
jgi:transposase